MKNKGLKNMMALAQAGHREELHKAAMISRQQTLDKTAIALHDMGVSQEDIREFVIHFQKAEQDFCEAVLVDAKDDKEIWYAREQIDRMLKEALPTDMFVPYDKRYNF